MMAMVMSASLLMTSCSKDDDGEDVDDCLTSLQALAQDLNAKGQVYVQNPTNANCLAVKNAGILLSQEAIDCGYEQFVTLAAQYKDLDCTSAE